MNIYDIFSTKYQSQLMIHLVLFPSFFIFKYLIKNIDAIEFLFGITKFNKIFLSFVQ